MPCCGCPRPRRVSPGSCPPAVQRLCPSCPEDLQRGAPEEEKEVLQAKSSLGDAAIGRKTTPEDEDLQRNPTGDAKDSAVVFAEVEDSIHTLAGRGSALPESVRAFMGPRFGADFSGVRVHTDAQAHELARNVNALAFTVGRDLVFAAGHYAPETERGRHLIAHELVHVVQQGATEITAGVNAQGPTDASDHRTAFRLAGDAAATTAGTGSIEPAAAEVGGNVGSTVVS